ncbi:MAG: putative Proteintyrosine phosphatase [Streblomastix strix]|uniref:Uncharacterized protein n=1 Tax=Streblomastix strix TaxID=222440 RepID=A0A5J4UTN9_9EUKA|nr:MAG: putative Proteintyrosine phosphatase [Streblomastix strix]
MSSVHPLDFIRKIVSHGRKRLVVNQFNLDITYITDRIIAMGKPSSGAESLYRNKLKDVADFLNTYHKDHYQVINLSQDQYDYSELNQNVQEFGFGDHHAPFLSDLFGIMQVMNNWLAAEKENIIAIHCKAGKGRTGAVICSYLLYSGQFNDSEECMDFFRIQRSQRVDGGGGIEVESQRRYVRYISEILKREIYPQSEPVKLNKIIITFSVNAKPTKVILKDITKETEEQASFKPVLRIIQQNRLVYDSRWGIIKSIIYI